MFCVTCHYPTIVPIFNSVATLQGSRTSRKSQMLKKRIVNVLYKVTVIALGSKMKNGYHNFVVSMLSSGSVKFIAPLIYYSIYLEYSFHTVPCKITFGSVDL